MPAFLPRGAKVMVKSGRHAGKAATVEANVYQKSVDYPDEYGTCYHLTLADGSWATVRAQQVIIINMAAEV